MGLKETRTMFEKCISRLEIVALSAQPPGVINCVCVCVCTVLFVQNLDVASGQVGRRFWMRLSAVCGERRFWMAFKCWL
jgi:hypothetical protein